MSEVNHRTDNKKYCTHRGKYRLSRRSAVCYKKYEIKRKRSKRHRLNDGVETTIIESEIF